MGRESVIVSDPEILGGTPCFRGTRVPVDTLIDYLEAGDTLDEFLDNFPSVSREAAIAALEEARTCSRPFLNAWLRWRSSSLDKWFARAISAPVAALRYRIRRDPLRR
ncbi:MAG: DUF433 domain-containing protein [Bryobacterales bacterium]|nr:DUF433 domain-containing protein [Bryobacterales bacterium]